MTLPLTHETAEQTQSTPAAGPARKVRLLENGNALLARVEGPLDLESAPGVLQRLQPLCREPRTLVIDLLQADYIDSSGVRAVQQLQEDLQRAGGELRLVAGAGSRVERVFTLLRLKDQLRIYETAADAWSHTASTS
jgi:anti-anti-sigma factor